MKTKQKVGLILAVIILIGTLFIPTSAEGLTVAGRNNLGLLLSVMVILITGALPNVTMCLVAIPLMFLMGVTNSMGGALNGFSNQTVFFILTSFGITTAMAKTNASKRLMVWLIRMFGSSGRMVLFAIMAAVALVSSICGNLVVVVAFVPLALDFINIYPTEEERHQTGKAFMIGIPVASMIGGILTPAGQAINAMLMGSLEEMVGIRITFVTWTAACAPIAIVATVLSFFIIAKINPPAPITKEQVSAYVERSGLSKTMSSEEKRLALIITVMFVCWIAGSWISKFNMVAVAMLGVVVMMLPKIGVMEPKDFMSSVNWNLFLTIGTLMGLTSLLKTNGVIKWVASVLPLSGLEVSPMLFTLILCLLCFLMLIVFPVGPALVMALLGPVVAIGVSVGINPAMLMVAVCICCCNCFLLPVDAIPLYCYNYGYFTSGELTKTTIWIQVVLAIITAVWLPIAANLLFPYVM